MKKKINEISVYRNGEGQKSDLYTRYKPAFNRLLKLNEFRNNSPRCKELYIPDENLDKQLNYIGWEDMDSMSVLIGYAGIGKSTSLRNVFGYVNSAPVYHEENKTLVFPATYNGCLLGEDDSELSTKDSPEIANKIREDMVVRIDAVNSFLENKFVGLKELFDSREGRSEFYQYLQDTNPRVLEYVPYEERRNLTKEQEIDRRLEYASRHERFVCAVTKLKYYLGKELCDCSKIIVILDDIEPLPYVQQKTLVMQYVRFFECMKNTSLEIAQKEYVVNVIIGMRPHTYRILKEHRAFKAFYVDHEILKTNMVDMSKLFQYKVEAYKNDMKHNDMNAWDAAKKALKLLCEKFHFRYANMIKNLCIWNTRDAMKIYQQVLENRIWVQKDIVKTSSFVINKDDYVFNNITVLRAIACKNYYVYNPQRYGFIPNILYNTADGHNYSFYIMCVLAYLHLDSTMESLYGTTSVTYGELIKMLTDIFIEYDNIEHDAKKVIYYLFSNKILRKSINDTDKAEWLDKEESLSDGSLLYLSPKGHEIWHMIESDSVYMELCREDYYRDYDNSDNCKESSYELFLKGEQKTIFIDLLKLLLELLSEEKKYVSYSVAKQTKDKYINHFGSSVICQHFYAGIKRSIDFSGYSEHSEVKHWMFRVEEKISEIENILQYE